MNKAPRQFFRLFSDICCDELYLCSCSYDNCTYVKENDRNLLLLPQDDESFLIAAHSRKAVEEMRAKLGNHFEIADCREANLFSYLKITIIKQSSLLQLSQKSYFIKGQYLFSMLNANACFMLTEEQILNVKLNDKNSIRTTGWEANGSLRYVMICFWPDTAFMDTLLMQFVENAATLLWTCMKTVF